MIYQILDVSKTNTQPSQLKPPIFPRLMKVKQAKSKMKVMLAAFIDYSEVMCCEYALAD